jgi:hypothetical protein
MERVKKYITWLIGDNLESKGYFYISDEEIFVQEVLSEIIEVFEDKFGDRVSYNQKASLESVIEIVKSTPEIFGTDKELENDFFTIANYQLYLNENGYDKRNKRKVREIFVKEILLNYEGSELKREQYIYYPKVVELNFIDNLSDIIEYLKKELSDNQAYFYRGHSNLTWKLSPTIYRKIEWIQNEHNMFREILLRNYEDFINTKSAFEKLTIMQHYGIPTRLLDITKNPLVALYFACSNLDDDKYPAELLIFNPKPEMIKYSDSDTISIISNIAKSERDLNITNQKDFNTTYKPGLKLLHLIKEEKPYFDNKIIPTDLEKTLVVKPINNNERIKRQQGYFFLFGIKGNILNSAGINSIYKRGNITPKYFIEEKNKSKIIDELESIGVSSDTLFPEIDKGAEFIKSKQ